MFESLEYPILLLFVLPVVLFVLVLVINSKAKIRFALGPIVTLSRAAMAAILLILVAGPMVSDQQESKRRLELLIDVSRSLGDDNRQQVLKEARDFLMDRAEAEPGLDLKAILFAGQPKVILRGAKSPEEIKNSFDEVIEAGDYKSLEPLGSDLEAAIAMADAGVSGADKIQRVIVTDGALPPRQGNASAIVPTVLMVPRLKDDEAIRAESILAPTRIDEGQPLPMEFTYTSSVEKKIKAALIIDGVKAKDLDVDLKIGRHTIAFSGKDLELKAGRHDVLIRLLTKDSEPLDDAAGHAVRVTPLRHVLFVKGDHRGSRAPAVLRALKAQENNVVAVNADQIPSSKDAWNRVKAVVLDRVNPAKIKGTTATFIDRHVRAGGGLWVIPRDNPNELLAWNESPLTNILPLTGVVERKPKKEEKPKKKTDEKLAPANPKKSKEKEIEAPTSAMLIVIDASASMKEGRRMLFAKKGAIATVRKLHPEDLIGVVAYNDRAIEVVPVQEAGNKFAIERAINRITPSGGTNIKSALEFAKETLAREDSAIKTIILLSDGIARPFNVKKTCEDILGAGITVTTVGIGSSFDVSTLTQIAKYSGGTGPIPARNASHLPAIMVDVAARLIDKHKLKKAPEKKPEEDDKIHRPDVGTGKGKPAVAEVKKDDEKDDRIDVLVNRPTSYLDGLPMNFVPSIYGRHKTQEKKGAWTSLATKNGNSVLTHWRVEEGVVAMTTLALEGLPAKDLMLWEAYSPLVSQVVRFCAWEAALERFQLRGEITGRRAVFYFDDGLSRSNAGAWTINGLSEEAVLDSMGPGSYLATEPSGFSGPFARFEIEPPAGGETQKLSLFVPPPGEVENRGLDLERLEVWASSLGARIESGGLGNLTLDLEPKRSWTRVPWPMVIGGWLLLAFAVELLVKRLLAKPEQVALSPQKAA